MKRTTRVRDESTTFSSRRQESTNRYSDCIRPRFTKPETCPHRLYWNSVRCFHSFKTDKDGIVEAAFRLEIPKRRISAAEFEAIRAAIEKYRSQLSERVNFVPETAELLAVGQTSKAVSLLRDSVAKHE